MKIFRIIILSALVFLMASHANSQELSGQGDKERLEVMTKLLKRYEADIERLLLEDMNRAMEKFHKDKDDSSRQEYESLLEQALALPSPSAKVFSACATASNLLGRPRQAIAILKKAIDAYPEDDHVWGPLVPLNVSGYYRIGSIATRIGDANEAAAAYEAAIGNCRGFNLDSYCKVMCTMHLVDIADRVLHDKQLALKRCREMIAEIDSVDMSGLQHGVDQSFIFLRDWALYEQKYLETGEAPSRDISKMSKQEKTSHSMLVMTHSMLSYCTRPEIEQAAGINSSSIDSIFNRLGLAFNYMERASGNYPTKGINLLDEAEKYINSVIETDSYFKVNAQAMLEMVQNVKDMLSKRISNSLESLKNGNMRQRNSAAFTMSRDPEGVKLLYQAQQDPNKYVRYAAACGLARRNRDPAYKADFDVILQALIDEDPQVRKTAYDVLGAAPRVEISPEEVASVIRLLNDHYSPELMNVIQRYISDSRESQDILNAAVPELAKLMSHPNPEVRGTVIGTLLMIRSSSARGITGFVQAVQPLVESLDKQDLQMQIRIIGLLGGIGPDAEPAIPTIIKYLNHENTNLRRYARDALRRISPTKADELLGKR